MAAKFTRQSGANTPDRLLTVGDAVVQLSDGTAVEMDTDGGAVPTISLVHTGAGHATATALTGTLTGSAWTRYDLNDAQDVALLRNASDDLIAVAGDQNVHNGYRGAGYTKGAGYTWTKQTEINSGSVGGATGDTDSRAHAAVWAATGGGTSSKGHTIAVCIGNTGKLYYVTADAGAMLAGSGTLLVNSGLNPTFLGTTSSAVKGGGGVAIAANGANTTSGLAACSFDSTHLTVGAWAVNSSGALSTNTNITTALTTGTQTATTKVVLIRVSSNRWLLLYPSPTTAGRVMGAIFSSTAQVGSAVEYGSVSGWTSPSASLSWDAYLDTVLGKVFLYSWSGTNMLRLGVSIAGDVVTWDSATTADDTSVGSGTNSTVRSVRQPTGAFVDWQTFNNNGAGTYALLGDYTVINTAPTIAYGASSLADGAFPNTATPTLTAYVSDPDASQTLTVTFDVATDSGFSSIVYTGTNTAASPQTAGAVSKTTSALTKGVLLYWRAKVSDGLDTSSYTATRTFTIYDDPTVTIGASTPSATTSTGGPNLTITYTYTQAQGLAQDSRRIRVQNAAGSTTYYDSGVVMAATVTLTIDAVAAGIPTDTTGTALKVVVDVVAVTSAAAGTANKSFDIQWGVVTLTITTPSNNSVIATTALTPAWSFASTRSKTQASYRFRLLQSGTGAVLYDSGYVTSAAASALLGYTLVDTGNYVLEVTAKNSEGVLSS